MTAPVLMVQGTASGVGKSVIAAGLCRILRRRGVRVAPFKAQNMSLNAAVTLDGGEIGRSTAVQAAAAGIEPTVDMNPILLKPELGMQSQVILLGKVGGTWRARDNLLDRPNVWPIVTGALDRLRAEYDVVVAEGAGSPAEMNLRERDLANMRVALHASAAVILVGDVERGGVFAQLVGTLDLLPPEERALARGLIVNRFRGEPALFAEGVTFLEQRTTLPVFGVVPYVDDLELAEEDSASLGRASPPRPGAGGEARPLRLVVTRLPYLANFDDFAPLGRLTGVAVDYVDRPEQIADADLVIVPGSKSTIADLTALRERGLATAIIAARDRGTPVLGICGGFQMLGREIRDPDRIESPTQSAPGLGLLSRVTTFQREKRTARVRARVTVDRGPFAAIRDAEIEGYEIHAGRTFATADGETTSLLRITVRGGKAVDDADGAVSDDGLVQGTYLHGLFENKDVTQALIEWLWLRRASPPRPLSSLAGEGEPERAMGIPCSPSPARLERGRGGEADPYDRWADALEAALDLPLLFDRCGIVVPRGQLHD